MGDDERPGVHGICWMLAEIVSVIGPRGWISASPVFGGGELVSIAFAGGTKKPLLGDWGQHVGQLAEVARDLRELAPAWGGQWPGRSFTVSRGPDGVTLELEDAVPPIRVGIDAAEEQARLFRDDVIELLSDAAPRTSAMRSAWRGGPATRLLATYQPPDLIWAEDAIAALRDTTPSGALRHVLSNAWMINESCLAPLLWMVADRLGAPGVDARASTDGTLRFFA